MPYQVPEEFSWGGTRTKPPPSLQANGYAFEDVPTAENWNWFLSQLSALTNYANAVGSPVAPRFEFTGDLSFCIGVDDVLYIEVGFPITEIAAFSRKTPASGSIQIDLLAASSPGGSLASLYSTNTKPSLVCTGAGASQVFTGLNLPNTTAIAEGSILALRILSAPRFADDLIVIVR